MKVYYLFERNPVRLAEYRRELLRVRENMDAGKTPVYSELRNARTSLYENLPYQALSGLFLILGTWVISLFKVPDIFDVAIVLIVQGFCGTIANYLFTIAKHSLRVRLCRLLSLEPSEEVIAAMESMEYQSV